MPFGFESQNSYRILDLPVVDDVDDFTKKAIATGVKVLQPVENQSYGDRSGAFLDPFGYKWTIATHVEDVSPEDMQRRVASATVA